MDQRAKPRLKHCQGELTKLEVSSRDGSKLIEIQEHEESMSLTTK